MWCLIMYLCMCIVAQGEDTNDAETHARDIPRVYALYGVLLAGIAIALLALGKYYFKRSSKEKGSPKEEGGAIENIKRAFALGMYRPGTLIIIKK